MSRAERDAPYAVLFDLDGTLIDSIGLLVASMEFAFGTRTRRPVVADWVAAIGTPLMAMLRPFAEDEGDADILIGRYREYQMANHDEGTTAYPGAVETVRALCEAGHPLAIVTSKLERGARRSLAHIGLEDCFQAVVGIDATEKHKPGPEPVWHALELIGARCERAIFIGDSTHDMRAGRAAGVQTGAALWGPFSRAQLEVTGPDHWFAHISEVPATVARLDEKGR